MILAMGERRISVGGLVAHVESVPAAFQSEQRADDRALLALQLLP